MYDPIMYTHIVAIARWVFIYSCRKKKLYTFLNLHKNNSNEYILLKKIRFYDILPFLTGPAKLIKNENFKNNIFSLFYFVTLTKKYVSITFKGPFKAPWGTLWKGPKTHQIRKFSNIIFFLHFYVTLSQHTKRLCL